MASTAVTRILWHAGLPFPKPGEDLPSGSLSTATWQLSGIREACDDLLGVLEILNQELNGTVPSEVSGSDKTNALSRELVWAMARILDQLQEATERSQDNSTAYMINDCREKVKFWWQCILDGDIDNIEEDWGAFLQTR